jgi:hypothetical protein
MFRRDRLTRKCELRTGFCNDVGAVPVRFGNHLDYQGHAYLRTYRHRPAWMGRRAFFGGKVLHVPLVSASDVFAAYVCTIQRGYLSEHKVKQT